MFVVPPFTFRDSETSGFVEYENEKNFSRTALESFFTALLLRSDRRIFSLFPLPSVWAMLKELSTRKAITGGFFSVEMILMSGSQIARRISVKAVPRRRISSKRLSVDTCGTVKR